MISSFKDMLLKTVYRTGNDNLYKDFYLPVLSKSIHYDRAVGFFSSSILSSNLQGLSHLIHNRGRMRLIIGQPLEPQEYEAILYEARNKSQGLTDRHIDELMLMLEEEEVSRLQILAHLVATQCLEIKFAVRPKGMYHEKIGIAYDEAGNCVVFQGSANETPSALFEHLNAECISVYMSWKEPGFSDYGQHYIDAFEALWEGEHENTIVLDVLSSHYQKIAQWFEEYLNDKGDNLLNFEKILSEIDDNLGDGRISEEYNYPRVPEHLGGHPFEIREHQRKALNSWKANEYVGILKHATGSGKTITAIYALTKIFEAKQKGQQSFAAIITVPYIDLAKQWVIELKRFNIVPIECFDNKASWSDILERKVQLFSLGDLYFLCILVVNKTLTSQQFQDLISPIDTKSLMVVGDECHRHGATQTRSALPDAYFRLGLSATPFHDDDEERESLFGDDAKKNILSYYTDIVHEYSLEDAIFDDVLTPYDYHIVPVYLTETEQQEFDRLSVAIRNTVARSGKQLSKEDKEHVLLLSAERSRLLGRAENKLIALQECIKDIDPDEKSLSLFYVGEGKDASENKIINEVTKVLRANAWKVSQFTGNTSKNDRREILSAFKREKIDALVAMKVLDEGIDVPACRTAYILASTKNPRQYVQRRGRVLRKFSNKFKATIYDFVMLPCPHYASEFAETLHQSELERIRDFSLLATNKIEIESLIDGLGMSYV